MLKEDVLKLAEDASSCFKDCFYDSNLLMYQRTNENLMELFKQFPVENKDVFTVLSSSDQLLSCHYHKAKKVEAFDKVYPTLFYYYLRKWVITFLNDPYPSYKFFGDGDKILYYLVCDIQPTNPDEEDAQLFWRNYLEQTNYRTNKYLFYISLCNWPVPFENDVDSIKDCFDKPLKFRWIDMFKEFDINEKHDVLILSNMLEFANNEKDYIQARDNIEALLRDGGIAICTYMKHKKDSAAHKKEVKFITSNSLKFDDTPHRYYEPLMGKTIDFAYSYKKVRK